MPVPVNFYKLLIACNDTIRTDFIPSYVHRLTGDILFIKDGDEVRERYFAENMPLPRIFAAVVHRSVWTW